MTDRKTLLGEGFLLLPPSPIREYRGVDRRPFEPLVLTGELDPAIRVQPGESHIWVLYPPGWRRDAYRLYEENSLRVGDDLNLLGNRVAACQIRRVIEPYLGFYEIIACRVWSMGSQLRSREESAPSFLGYDIAYCGGDFYSAILNGLLLNPDPRLVGEYGSLLNQFRLFATSDRLVEYAERFKAAVVTEAASRFCVYELSLASP